jgi:hypothetical protein
MMKFELYQPPMVEKSEIPVDERNTFYVRVQSKLYEIEHGKKSMCLI